MQTVLVMFTSVCLCLQTHDSILVESGSIACSNLIERIISEHQIPGLITWRELMHQLKYRGPCQGKDHERPKSWPRAFAAASSLNLRGGYAHNSEDEGMDQSSPKLGSGTDELRHARSENRPPLDEEVEIEHDDRARKKSTVVTTDDAGDSRRTRRRRRREQAQSVEEDEEDEEDEESDEDSAEEERLALARTKEEEEDDDDDEDYGLESSEVVARARVTTRARASRSEPPHHIESCPTRPLSAYR
jgi:hypothetical protein